MKALDLLLLSMAIGLLAFTITLFGSDYPRGFTDPATAETPREPAGFQAIVIHSSEAHPGLPFHFMIGDEVTPCGAWKAGERPAHTSNAECNALAISIAVRPGQTLKQEQNLLDLLERLCRSHHIDPAEVGAHFEVESTQGCPPETWNMTALRNELARRLEGTISARAPDPAEPE